MTVIKRFLCCLFIPALVQVSCTRQTSYHNFFNVDSLINDQVHSLANANAMLIKEATIDGVSDKNNPETPDTARWRSELEIFRQINAINKPANRNFYLVEDGLFDPHSNLTVKSIRALDDLPVRYVRIFYTSEASKPRKIEALYEDESSVQHSSRLLTMEFQQVRDQYMLTRYRISGGHKMIMTDSVTYEIDARIVFDKTYGKAQ